MEINVPKLWNQLFQKPTLFKWAIKLKINLPDQNNLLVTDEPSIKTKSGDLLPKSLNLTCRVPVETKEDYFLLIVLNSEEMDSHQYIIQTSPVNEGYQIRTSSKWFYTTVYLPCEKKSHARKRLSCNVRLKISLSTRDGASVSVFALWNYFQNLLWLCWNGKQIVNTLSSLPRSLPIMLMVITK